METRRRTLNRSKLEDFRYLIAAATFYSIAACTVANDDPLSVNPDPNNPETTAESQSKKDGGAPNSTGTGGMGQTLPDEPDAAVIAIDAAAIPTGTGGTSPPPVTGGNGGTSPAPATGGSGGTSPVPPVRATSYDFEVDSQSWVDLKAQGTIVARTTAKAAKGTASLAVSIDTQTNTANGMERYIGVPRTTTPTLKAGQTIKYQVWVPSGNKLLGVQPFVVTQGNSRAGVGRWQGTYTNVDALAKDAWNTINVVLPADYEVNDLEWFGVQFLTQAGGWKGTVYIDAVSF